MKELHVEQLENQQLSTRLKRALLETIRASVTDDRPLKLPKEEVLAQQLGVSRNALRDVLAILEEEGYLSRRRSKGTIANPQIVKSTCRLDLEMELCQMIEEEGLTARFETLDVSFREEPDPVFGPLEPSYLRVEKLFFADGLPVAHCVDRIPGHIAQRGVENIQNLRQLPHFAFLETCCHDSISCVLAEIVPLIPDAKTAALLRMQPGDPLLCLHDTGFNADQEIVLHSTLLLKPGNLRYKILRKRF